MIFKRAVANLRAQNWMAITIELAIVIIGVFIGIQVANWNEDRLEKREANAMLTRLEPELRFLLDYYETARSYYATTRAYATTALAGWRGDPRIADRDFVIAAYQASQIYGTGTDHATWATVIGADRLRTIGDPVIRDHLAYLMYGDNSQIDAEAVDTPYRQNVRRIIPVEIQDAIRARCGDRSPANSRRLLYLPRVCDLDIPADAAARAAAALRAHPELAKDLQWHTAAVASFLENMGVFEATTITLKRQIDGLDK